MRAMENLESMYSARIYDLAGAIKRAGGWNNGSQDCRRRGVCLSLVPHLKPDLSPRLPLLIYPGSYYETRNITIRFVG